MSFTGGSASGLNVGTLTATYKIDASQGMTQVGTLIQQADTLKNAFGNVQIKLDGANYKSEMAALVQSTVQLKQAQADQATSTAALRQAQQQLATAGASVRQQNLANAQAIGQVRAAQVQQAQASTQARAAQDQLNTATVTARANTAAYNEESARLRNEMVQMRLAAMQAAQAVQQQGQAHQSLAQFIQQSTLAGVAFRAGEDLLQASLQAVKTSVTDSVGAFISWEQTLQRIQANSTLTAANIATLDQSVRTMATQAPINMNAMAQGFRLTSDEAFNMADAQKIATAAMMSAVGTGADETQTMNMLATAMHIFHLNADEATTTMGLFQRGAALGRLDMEQFVTGTQRAQTAAAKYGVSLTDTVSALAALTRNGFTATQAQTQFINVLTHIADPGKAASDELMRLSKTTGVDLVTDFTHAGLAAKGFSGVMADVQKVIEITGDQSIISKLIPSLRGAQGAYALLGNGANDYKSIQMQLNAVNSGQSSPVMDAYTAASKTAAFQIGVLKNDVHLLGLELGQFLLPVLEKAVGWMKSLLTAMGVKLDIPAFAQAKTAMDGVGTSTTTATEATKQYNDAAQEDKTQALMRANDELEIFSDNALDAAKHVMQLTGVANDLKTQMDSVTEKMASVKDYYAGLLDPLKAQVAQIEQLTPEESARKVSELQLQQQEINLKLNAPDTSAFTTAIDTVKQQLLDLGEAPTQALDASLDTLHQQLDDLGDAATDTIDAKIDGLRNRLQDLGKISTVEFDKQINALRTQVDAIGDTKDMDRRIQDIQREMQKPEQSTAAQEAGMASLASQLGAGTITQSVFDAQYGALGRQKQQIIDNNNTRKTALQQELSDLQEKRDLQQRTNDDAKSALDDQIKGLERRKQDVIDANTIEKAGIQDQIDAATKQREAIVKAHDEQKKGIEAQIKEDERQKKVITDNYNTQKKMLEDRQKQLEIDKSNATAAFDAKMREITAEQDHNKLLDDAAAINRQILEYPRKAKIDEYTAAESAALVPLQAQKDSLQEIINKNNEDLATWRQKEAEIKANEAAARALINTLKNGTTDNNQDNGGDGGPENPPGGPDLNPPGDMPPLYLGPGGNQFDSKAGISSRPAWMTTLVDAITTTEQSISGVTTRIVGDFDQIRQWGSDHSDDLKKFFGTSWQEAIDFASTALDYYESLVKTVSGVIQTMIDLEQHNWSKAWQDIQDIVSTGKDKTYNLYDEFGNKIGSLTQTQLNDWKSKHKIYQDNLLGDYQKWWDKYGLTQKQGEGPFDTELDRWLGSVFGPSGKFGTGFSNLGTTTNDWLGAGGKVGEMFDRFGSWLGGDEGWGTQTMNALKNSWTQGVTDVETTSKDWFGDNGKIGQKFDQFGTYLRNLFGQGGPIASAMGQMGSWIGGVVNTIIVNPLNDGITRFASFVNSIGGGITDLAGKLHVPLTIGTWTPDLIPPLAMGTENWQGGVALVGDAGRELAIIDGQPHIFDQPTLVDLPQGTVIKPNADTERILNASIGTVPGATVNGLVSSIKMGDLGNYGLAGTGGLFDALGNAKDAAIGGIKALAGDAKHAVQAIISKGIGAAIGGIMDAAGVPDLTMGGANLGEGAANLIRDLVTTGVQDLWDAVKGNLTPDSTGGHGTAGGFRDMLMPDYLAYMDSYGGPLDTESGYNYLMSVARERNMDPRWLMAVMQTETGYGNNAGRLRSYDNFIGMEVNDRGYSFDSGVAATDSGAHFAGYASIRDMLEDLAAWIAANGTSFVSYDGSGVAKNQTYQDLVRIIGSPTAAAGPFTNASGGWPDVVNQAASFIGDVQSNYTPNGLWAGYCEAFVEMMDRLAGFPIARYGSAIEHYNAVGGNSGDAPPGATLFFPRMSAYGHVAIAVGDGVNAIGTRGMPGDSLPNAEYAIADQAASWAPPGLMTGGVARDPVIVRIGDIPGRVPEIVAPQPMLQQSVADGIRAAGGVGGNVSITFEAGSIVGAPGQDTDDIANAVADKLRTTMQRIGKQV